MNEHIDKIKRKCTQYGEANNIGDEEFHAILNFIFYACQNADEDFEQMDGFVTTLKTRISRLMGVEPGKK